MSDDKDEIARLEQANSELTQSLKRCQEMLGQWRSRLVADNNEADLPDTSFQDDDKLNG